METKQQNPPRVAKDGKELVFFIDTDKEDYDIYLRRRPAAASAEAADLEKIAKELEEITGTSAASAVTLAGPAPAGYMALKVISFTMISEFLGADVKFSGEVVSIRLNERARLYRQIRNKFYNILYRYAVNTALGWIYAESDNKFSDFLAEIAMVNEELKKVGIERKIEVYDVLLPTPQARVMLSEALEYVTAAYNKAAAALAAEVDAKKKKLKERELARIRAQLERLERLVRSL